MTARLPSRTQSDTPNITAGRIAVIRVHDAAGNVIETHETRAIQKRNAA
jgi:hypothetical protein